MRRLKRLPARGSRLAVRVRAEGPNEVARVNAVALLMGLLVLSYLGSFLVSRRSVGGVGLPSGIEYVTLGFALGPRALDLVAARDISAFEPVAQVALGWLAFGFGLDFGFANEKRVRTGRIALGILGAVLASVAVA